MNAQNPRPNGPIQAKALRCWKETIRPLASVALVVFGFRSAVADWNHVPTGSMQPTILEGDRVFVNRMAYDLKVPFTTWHLAEWSGPERGDIVVFYSPRDGQRLVKRVVGLPGDIVSMTDNRLSLNGETLTYGVLKESFVQAIPQPERGERSFASEELPDGRSPSHPVMASLDRQALRSFGPIQVPAGRYFMLGDNRDNSLDSRFFGTVERQAILGRAVGVVGSLDASRGYVPRWERWFTPLP
jgi:signal peptidase I